MCLVAVFGGWALPRPTCWGSLQHSPKPLAELSGRGGERSWKRGGEGEGKGGGKKWDRGPPNV